MGEVVGSKETGYTLKVGATYNEGNVDQDATDQKPKGPSDCPNKNFPLPNIPLKADTPKYDNSPGNPPKEGGVDTTGNPPLVGGAGTNGGPPPPGGGSTPGPKPPIQGGTDKTGDPPPPDKNNTPGPVDLKPGTGTPDNTPGTPGKPPLKTQIDKNNDPLQPLTPQSDPDKPKKKKKIKIKINNDPCKNITSVTNNNDNPVALTGAILQKFIERATGNPKRKSRYDLNVIASLLNDTMQQAQINNRRRQTAFLAQVVMETAYFDYLYELGRGKGKSYGNYYGRGLVQLTHEVDYKAAGKALDKNNPNRLVNNPGLVETDPEVDAAVTAWYWLNHHAKGAPTFNELADAGNFAEITHHLYGGTIHSRNAAVRRSVKQRDCYHLLIQQVLNESSTAS